MVLRYITGPIASFSAIQAGTSYADGTYPNVPLTGGSGTGAYGDIVVSSGSINITIPPAISTSAVADRTGKNYVRGDQVGVNPSFDGVGNGTGFVASVNILADACENCYFGRIVPSLLGGQYTNMRYCGNLAPTSANTPFKGINRSYQDMIVNDDFWCSNGANIQTLNLFVTKF